MKSHKYSEKEESFHESYFSPLYSILWYELVSSETRWLRFEPELDGTLTSFIVRSTLVLLRYYFLSFVLNSVRWIAEYGGMLSRRWYSRPSRASGDNQELSVPYRTLICLWKSSEYCSQAVLPISSGSTLSGCSTSSPTIHPYSM